MPNAPDIILTHLHLEAYRGIDLMDIDLPPRGVIFSGSKGKGKTSGIFKTHPPTSERLAKVKALACDAPPSKGEAIRAQRFKEIVG